MKLFLLFLSLTFLISSCTNQYSYEDQICDCYEENMDSTEVGFVETILKLEGAFIINGVLKDGSGESYLKRVKLITSDVSAYSSLDSGTYLGDDLRFLLESLPEKECFNLILNAPEHSTVKGYLKKYHERIILQKTSQTISAPELWSDMEAFLTAEDLEHPYYKLYFYLNYFFVIDVERGISAVLPLKEEGDSVIDATDTRNKLVIVVDDQNQIFVNGHLSSIADLHEQIDLFYAANADGENENPNFPTYTFIDKKGCTNEIEKLEFQINNEPNSGFLKSELAKWKEKKELCEEFDNGFMEISSSAVIKLTNHRQTSYSLYIEIQNVLKQVINDLRQEKCEQHGWPNYFNLKDSNEEDRKIIKKLRILVPERVIESKIQD